MGELESAPKVKGRLENFPCVCAECPQCGHTYMDIYTDVALYITESYVECEGCGLPHNVIYPELEE